MPLLLFLIFQLGFTAREQRRATEAQAINKAEQLISAADGEVARITTVLEALATSSATRDDDWTQLTARFAQLAALNPDVKGLEVSASDGRLLLQAGARIDRAAFVAEGGQAARPLFTGFARAGSCRCLIFQQAAANRAGTRYVFTLLTDADVFLRLLPSTGQRFEVSAFNAPDGRFIARTLNNDRRFGAFGSHYLRGAVRSGKAEGIYRGFTLEGFKNYTAFARSPRTGWSAHVAINSSYIDAPARQFIAALATAGLLSLGLAGLLIAFAVRQLNAARQVSERLGQAQKLEALGQLTGGIAHDFNNLLTPIVGALDQLRQRPGLDERGRQLAAGALVSAERAAKLTGQLLTFSRRQQLRIMPVDVRELVGSLTALVEQAFGSDHRFEASVDDRVHCVTSDANQLELALLNLAINGRDASPNGSTITLTVEPVAGAEGKEPEVLFRMIDRGTGMDEETRRRAMEPFFTTKPIGRGTGLGLAQVLGAVDQSGGTIAIDSKPGEGTIVSIRLPGCSASPASAGQADPPAAPASVLPLRLLVVDDDSAVRATTARLLEAMGHSVDSVSHGTTALAALAAERFDLMIVDFAMPGMNGAELLHKARQVRPDLRALVISGFSDTEALAASGVDAPILAKPFSSDQLLEAVGRAVSG